MLRRSTSLGMNFTRLLAGLGVAVILACSDAADAPPKPSPAPAPAPAAKSAAAPAKPPPAEEPAPSPEELAAEGRRVYLGNCTACHAMDPSQPGSLGPELVGSSRALIEARVLRGEYPNGYKPKRTTNLMIPLPHLKDDIDALAAYLAR